MARPEMERRAGDRNPGAPNSCRMEVLRQDAWPCHRHRTIATQTSTVLPPLTQVPTQDAFSSDSVPQQDNPLRDNTGKVLQHRDSLSSLADSLALVPPCPPTVHPIPAHPSFLSTNGWISAQAAPACSYPGNKPEPGTPALSSHLRRGSADSYCCDTNPLHGGIFSVHTCAENGDEMNAVFLQRNAVPGWQNWRGLYHGLFAFVADTINALYQHGLR
ncbi:uncharacterized protein LOC107743728 [Sinocyclocheilus rhinocerous]|uniref:uncharacterized protein LOC107743728 n=1 Tax=Sinocyclocheilus rhinocerous TaxID=307959 RepID=UPI0007B9CAB2|nr:PREDICTED: uncharacterized protein LOC107743728 [Sinocyclocheilus rhinocerous]